MAKSENRPRLVFTTDLNGTTTPENTFAGLVHDNPAAAAEMRRLMEAYTTGRSSFAGVMPDMARLAAGLTRSRVEDYARSLPLFPGAAEVLESLSSSATVSAACALSTTGFAGLAAIVNGLRHGGRLLVAASPVLVHLLNDAEKSRLIRPITAEADKTRVLDDLAALHRPSPGLIFHVGDTLGDLPGILHAAELGGLGIAFNPNAALLERLKGLPPDSASRVRIIRPEPGKSPDYGEVGAVVRERIWEKTRTGQ